MKGVTVEVSDGDKVMPRAKMDLNIHDDALELEHCSDLTQELPRFRVPFTEVHEVQWGNWCRTRGRTLDFVAVSLVSPLHFEVTSSYLFNC